jgi:hypothetical protein
MARARETKPADLLISGHDREVALLQLQEAREAGYITGQEDFDFRTTAIADATVESHLRMALSGLPETSPARDGLRASQAQRDAAARKLAIHHQQGRLSDAEYERRRLLVENHSVSPRQIARSLEGLPPIKPARSKRDERLTSDTERDQAIGRLNGFVADGTLTIDEHRERVDAVRNARSRDEIAAAFDDLLRHDYQKLADEARHKAKVAGTQVFGVAAAALRGIAVAIWAVLSVVIGITWLVSGIGPVVPLLLLGLLLFLLRILLTVLPSSS